MSRYGVPFAAVLVHRFRRRTTGACAVSDDADLETVVGLLDDNYVRTILLATSENPLSASELTEECNASQQTVYRRLERLQEAGLVDDQTRVRKDGHHDTVYTATLDRVSIRLRDGAFEFELERTHTDAADKLTDLWRKF